MISGIDLNATIDFTVPGDKTNPTVWKLGPVSSIVSGQTAMAGSKGWLNAIMMARVGLKGWANYKIAGKDVPFETAEEEVYGSKMTMVKLELVNTIPPLTLMAITQKVYAISHMTVDEAKN